MYLVFSEYFPVIEMTIDCDLIKNHSVKLFYYEWNVFK